MGSEVKSGLRLNGKVALITGASRGLGAAMGLHLAEAGADIVVNYVNSEKQADVLVTDIKKLGVKAVAIKADVSQISDITLLFEKTLSEFGRLDIVINNAGIEYFAPVEDVTGETYDRVFGLNTRAQFFVAGRLKALGLNYLIIDQEAKVGDNWLDRYDSARCEYAALCKFVVFCVNDCLPQFTHRNGTVRT
jgi:NAD(P)-dependent dehydrogenase (short-subunit alcohol dehydrogenase family)